MMDSNEAAGKVSTHEVKILRMTIKFNAPIPLASPTPNTAPTSVCVAETGIPVVVATTTVVAAAKVAVKARLGVKAGIELPTVSITFLPYIKKPVMTPIQPIRVIQEG